MYTTADCSVLCRQAKCIKTHWVKHIVALHPLEAGVNIGGGHCVPMPDVEVSRRIGEHGELIPLRSRVILVNLIEAVLSPPLLPF